MVLAQGAGSAVTDVETRLASIGGVEIAGSAPGSDQIIELVKRLRPDLVLVAPELAGSLETIVVGIPGESAATRVLLAVTEADVDLALQAVRSGASGVLVLSASDGSLHRTLRGVANRGEIALPRALARRVISQLTSELGRVSREFRPLHSKLSDREWEILHLVADGKTAGQIAIRLGISTETIRTHGKNIRRKLGTSTTREAAGKLGELKRQALAAGAEPYRGRR